MGQNQSLDSMTHNRSKEELLHQLVSTGNVDAIKALRREGVNLEWIDREGKTPLIVASMDSGLINVAKTLIEIGANVNAYRPGRHAGTPLHHAAKRGLEQTVLLLLSSGANALIRNDDCHTALDVARTKGHTNVVRAIENHIGYFTGWLRELNGPSFLEALAPQLVSRKIWVVVLPCGSSNPTKPVKLELSIYPTLQDYEPRSRIALWKSTLEEPKFGRSDPALTIIDNSTKTRYRFASSNEGDKEQLRTFYDACKGISQVTPPTVNHNAQTTFPDMQQQQSAEALELAMAISASIQSTSNSHHNSNSWEISSNTGTHNGWGPPATSSTPQARPPPPSAHHNSNGWEISSNTETHNGWGPPATTSTPSSEPNGLQWLATQQTSAYNSWLVHNPQPAHGSVNTETAPSAPLMPEPDFDDGPISYPSIEGLNESAPDLLPENGDDRGSSSSCVICWEAPVEGACVPCGHMAGCMACLNEVKRKNGVCPVCRAKMKQVIRIYAV